MKVLKFIFTLLCIVAVALVIYYAATGSLPQVPKLAEAAELEVKYTGALEDLHKDERFNADNYPEIANNYSIQVVQLAEGANGELFVYTYEPSTEAKAHACSINISQAINDSLQYKNYALTHLSSEETLNKYLVNNLVIKQDALRYYDVSNIYRAWSEELGDDPNENGNVITEVPFAVGQLWTAATINGSTSYKCTQSETIEVTEKYVGFVRYYGGFHLFGGDKDCDSHFVAFSTDKNIETLVEADVYYKTQSYSYWLHKTSITGPSVDEFGKIKEQYTTLDNTQEGTFEGDGWFHAKFTFDRISEAQEFINNETRSNIYEAGVFGVKTETQLTEQGLNNLKNKQWVLRFYESAYTYTDTAKDKIIGKTIVSDVSILRLKFETNGNSYNLGVVDNKQSEAPDQDPDNETKTEITLPAWVQKIIDWCKNVWTIYKGYVIAIGSIIAALVIVNIAGKFVNKNKK